MAAETNPTLKKWLARASHAWERAASSRKALPILLAVGLVLSFAIPEFGLVNKYIQLILMYVGINIILTISLNLVNGYMGEFSVGHAGFMAVGAYISSVLTTMLLPRALNPYLFPLVVFAGGVGAALVGLIVAVPSFRTRGDYLAIITLGFGEIIRILAQSDWLRPYLGGSQGIAGIAPATLPLLNIAVAGPKKPQLLFYLILAACLLAVFVARRLRDSRLGRAWMAIREDEDVAEAMGIHLVKTKLMAFGTGACLSGLAGTLFGVKLTTIYPHSFALLVSINILAVIIVGGMGSIAGVMVGALALVGLPELLRDFQDFRWMAFGAVLVWMMLNRPEGLLPDAERRRELRPDAAAAAD